MKRIMPEIIKKAGIRHPFGLRVGVVGLVKLRLFMGIG